MEKLDYKQIATEIRKTVLRMLFLAQTSHIGSNYSCIDILTVLYSKMDPKKDKLVVSKGWVAASIYALNVKYGYMPQEAIDTYCDGKSKYIGLIEPIGYFGCETASGSMGLGLPTAVGLALAKKLKGEEGKVYCLMSDGELQCGTTWEAALIAAHHKLDNLVVMVDNNGLQAMGPTQDILKCSFPINPERGQKGWHYRGLSKESAHDFEKIEDLINVEECFKSDIEYYGPMPFLLEFDTTKGKGVSFMENSNLYHYKQLSEEEYTKALKELK